MKIESRKEKNYDMHFLNKLHVQISLRISSATAFSGGYRR